MALKHNVTTSTHKTEQKQTHSTVNHATMRRQHILKCHEKNTVLPVLASKPDYVSSVGWAVAQLVCGDGWVAGRVEHEVGCGNCVGW